MPKTSSHPASATAAPPANGVEVQRLPVNPRRKKVAPDERKRVATACNSCNIRRIKCSGEKPCQQCAGASRPCLYPPPTQKVTVTKAWVEDMKRRNAELELGLRLFGQGEDLFKHLRISLPYGYQSEGESEDENQVDSEGDTAIPDIEGKMLLDDSGTSRFLGETSGATFLDTLKGFIRTSASLPDGNVILFLQSEGHYQTSDSLPLQMPPDDQVDVSWLPPSAEAKRLLAIVRNAIMDGNGSYPCGGIFFWPLMDLDAILAELSPQGPAVQPIPEQSYRPLAVYHAAFAFATILEQTGANSRREGQNGEVYFARARKVLGNPFDIHLYSIHDVPALTLMALYYIENNRRDAASTYISTAMNLCRMHGVDRGSSDDLAEHRVFWTLYILDRWLSCLMGRLPMVPDDAIKLPMPQACRGLPLPVGLQAHVELSYISNFIVHNSTRDRGCKNRNGFPRGVGIAQTMLSKWMETLPDSLKIKSSPTDPDRPFHVDTAEIARKLNLNGEGIDRALLSLHMSYNQLVILTVRPAFLAAVRRAVATGFLDETTIWSPDDDKIIKNQGLRNYADVARVNIDLARQLWNDGERKLLVQDLHHVFNAAIILLMYQMLFMNQRTSDTLAIDLAIGIFRKEQEAGSGFGTDCLHVLEDLKMLVGKLRPTIFRYDGDKDVPQKREFDFNVPLRPRESSSSPPLQPDLKNKLESWKSEKSSLYNSGGCMVDNK